jgi:hypothetical protein
MILVAGGSGRLGTKVVTLVRQQGLAVRVRRIAIGVAAGLLLLALVLFVLVTVTRLPHTTHPSKLITPRVVTSPEEQPAQTGGQR